jgi:Bacterial SH3 domain
MKRILVGMLLAVLCSLTTVAQDGPLSGIILYDFGEKTSTYIYADTARVRMEPSLQATVLDTLLTGDELTIVRKTDVELMGSGKTANWFSVQYIKNGTKKNGYIWGGLLSLKSMRRGNLKFVYGINTIVADDTIKYESDVYINQSAYAGLKVVQNNKVISRIQYKIGRESAVFTYAGMSDGKKLRNIEYIIRLGFSGEACGIPAYDNYFLWNGKALIPMPQISSSADAGAYAHSEHYIFPSDKGGKPGKVLFKEETMEEEEGKKPKISRKTKVYNWNGTALL